MDNEKKQQQESANKVAGRNFDFDDYKKDDQVSSGLAETHEQISDDYYSGTIDQQVLDKEQYQKRDENK
ncbi:DUF4025 domain-containing protein [Peribacillus cavernae]|uniref:DUF4025 domain-containing protein n=1 Tax=Peribacillus cavernae TaxID=1674310 RepID=A0A433HIQ0_9BACI|nr:YozQ family protein [Peribacillus cavernae]MDQ0217802.1 hypothetical protein [Peribacillus cavernae]RUQ28254.1 DUF4025 domain-containing protein [Peribacillus cavernae]